MDYDKKDKVLLVIPAFNEEENITTVISGVKDLFPELDILVVDDGSDDKTSDISRSLGAFVVTLPFNLGYGTALQTGFKYAAKNNYDYLIHMDADGQHDPESISLLIKEITNSDVDIVIGSRFLESSNYKHVFFKRVGIIIFRVIINLFTGEHITDPTSGFQALNRKAFEFYSYIYPADFPDTDVIITSHRCGFSIKEIPVKIYPRVSGKSMHSGLKPIYYIFKMFLSIFVTILRKNPTK